jgi:hypothetical protein
MAKAAFPKPLSFWNGLGAAQVQNELVRVRCVGGNCGLWCSMLSTFKWVKSCHSISSGAQYVTQDRYCSHPSLVIYFFATPPLKLKQQIGEGQLIANHLDQSLWSPLSTSQIIFITLFLAGAKAWSVPFTSQRQIGQLCWAKTNFLSQTGIFWLFFIQFYYAGSQTKHSWRCSKG